jgi:bifunctional DNA-binding transcriptional regulator/antitoxin component of YhaV-PrlF toxin-antitoxin module
MGRSETFPEGSLGGFKVGSVVKPNYMGVTDSSVLGVVISRDKWAELDGHPKPLTNPNAVLVRHADGGIGWDLAEHLELVREATDSYDEFPLGSRVRSRFYPDSEGEVVSFIDWLDHVGWQHAGSHYGERPVYFRYDDGTVVWNEASGMQFADDEDDDADEYDEYDDYDDEDEVEEVVPEQSYEFPLGSIVRHKGSDDGYRFVVITREEYLKNENYDPGKDVTFVKYADSGRYGWNYTDGYELVGEPAAPQDETWDKYPFPVGSRVSLEGCGEKTMYTVITKEEFLAAKGEDLSYGEESAVFVKDDEGKIIWEYAKWFALEEETPETLAVGTRVRVKVSPWNDGQIWEVIRKEDSPERTWASEDGPEPWIYLRREDGAYGRGWPSELEVVEDEPKWSIYPFPVGSYVYYEGCGGRTRYTVVTKEEYVEANNGEDFSYGEEDAVFIKDDSGKVEWGRPSSYVSQASIDEKVEKLLAEDKPEFEPGFPVGAKLKHESDTSPWVVVSRTEWVRDQGKDGSSYAPVVIYVKNDKGRYAYDTPEKWTVVGYEADADGNVELVDGFPEGAILRNVPEDGSEWKVVTRSEYIRNRGYDVPSDRKRPLVYVHGHNKGGSTRYAWNYPSKFKLVTAEERAAAEKAAAEVNDDTRSKYKVGTRVYTQGCGSKTYYIVIGRDEFLKAGGFDDTRGEKGTLFVRKEKDPKVVYWGYDADYRLAEDQPKKAEVQTVEAESEIQSTKFAVGTRVKQSTGDEVFTIATRKEFVGYHRHDVAKGKDASKIIYIRDRSGYIMWDWDANYVAVEDQPRLVDVPAAMTLSAESEGRLNVPAEMLRETLGVKAGDKVYVQFNGKKLVLTPDAYVGDVEKSYTVTVRGNIRISKDVIELLGGEKDDEYECVAKDGTLEITLVEPLNW